MCVVGVSARVLKSTTKNCCRSATVQRPHWPTTRSARDSKTTTRPRRSEASGENTTRALGGARVPSVRLPHTSPRDPFVRPPYLRGHAYFRPQNRCPAPAAELAPRLPVSAAAPGTSSAPFADARLPLRAGPARREKNHSAVSCASRPGCQPLRQGHPAGARSPAWRCRHWPAATRSRAYACHLTGTTERRTPPAQAQPRPRPRGCNTSAERGGKSSMRPTQPRADQPADPPTQSPSTDVVVLHVYVLFDIR